MTELVSFAELLLAVTVVLGLGGLGIVAILRALPTCPRLIPYWRVVLIHTGNNEEGFCSLLTSYLRQRDCQVESQVSPGLTFERANREFFELRPQIDYVIGLTVETTPDERINVLPAMLTIDPYALSVTMVKMPTVEYTVALRIRDSRGVVYRRVLYAFRWKEAVGNTAAEEVGQEIVAVLSGTKTTTSMAVTA